MVLLRAQDEAQFEHMYPFRRQAARLDPTAQFGHNALELGTHGASSKAAEPEHVIAFCMQKNQTYWCYPCVFFDKIK